MLLETLNALVEELCLDFFVLASQHLHQCINSFIHDLFRVRSFSDCDCPQEFAAFSCSYDHPLVVLEYVIDAVDFLLHEPFRRDLLGEKVNDLLDVLDPQLDGHLFEQFVNLELGALILLKSSVEHQLHVSVSQVLLVNHVSEDFGASLD